MVVACLPVFGGMGLRRLVPRGEQKGGRRAGIGCGPLGNGQANASIVSVVRGDLTVGCVWQSAYPPDERFTDPRVHRFSPRHRKPARLIRMARAATPLMLRLRARLFPPEMHEEPAEVL